MLRACTITTGAPTEAFYLRAAVLERVRFSEACESQREFLGRTSRRIWPARLVPACGISDLVQVTLLRACQGWDSYRGESTRELRSWLKRILRNVVSNEVRRIRAIKRGGDGSISPEVEHATSRE